jgi:5'-3' exonuclease
MRVHLIDGTYELFRRYYGAPKRKSSSSGREIAATRSLARSLLTLIDSGVTHVAAAFDTVIESFRNDLYAGYKTGAGIEEALADQFELAERATRALGVVTWSMIEFEADDAIATATRRYLADPAVEQVIICSPDKDLHQCVDGARVVIWDQLRDTVRDEAAVIEKFGVPPAAIPDYLALIGDAADGFPGLPGWGARSTAAVLAAHGTIEAIPDDAAAWKVKVRGAARLAETLRERRDEAMLYKRLATLRLDVPLAESVGELAWRGPDARAIEALARELDDHGLVARAAKLSAAGA